MNKVYTKLKIVTLTLYIVKNFNCGKRLTSWLFMRQSIPAVPIPWPFAHAVIPVVAGGGALAILARPRRRPLAHPSPTPGNLTATWLRLSSGSKHSCKSYI